MSDELVCGQIEEKAKPLEVILVGQKQKKKRHNTLEIIKSIISMILGPAVAITALIFTLNPTLNKRNMNYEQQALMGDIEAQMFLADYNYQVGKFETSVYYYNVILKRPKTENAHERLYAVIANNNLGYLYMNQMGTGLPVSKANDMAIKYLRQSLNSEVKTVKLQLIVAQNIFAFLVNNNLIQDETFINLLDQVETILKDNEAFHWGWEYELFSNGYLQIGTVSTDDGVSMLGELKLDETHDEVFAGEGGIFKTFPEGSAISVEYLLGDVIVLDEFYRVSTITTQRYALPISDGTIYYAMEVLEDTDDEIKWTGKIYRKVKDSTTPTYKLDSEFIDYNYYKD